MRTLASLVLLLGLAPLAASQGIPLQPAAHLAEGEIGAVHVRSDGVVLYQDGRYLVAAAVDLALDSARVRPLSRVKLSGLARRIASEGTHAYVATNRGLSIVDLADLARPVETDTLARFSGHESVDVFEGVVYAGRRMGGVDVVDVSRTEAVVLAFVETGGGRTHADIEGEVLFVLDGYPLNSGVYFSSFDVSDPSQPVLLDEVTGNNTNWDLLVVGATAYTVSGADVSAIDVRDPSVLLPIDTHPSSYVPWALTPEPGGGVYVYEQRGASGAVYTARRSDHQLVVERSGGLLAGNTIDAAYSPTQQVALVAEDGRRLHVVDPVVQDPELGMVLGGGRSSHVALDGDLLFIAGDWQLRVVDIRDLDRPVVLAQVEMDGITDAIAAREGVVYLSKRFSLDDEIWAVDVSDPGSPEVSARTPIGRGVARSLALHGDRLYAPAGLDGVTILDVSAPLNPVVVGQYPVVDDREFYGEAVSVDAEAGLLYVVDDFRGSMIRILGVGSGGVLEEVGTLPLDEKPEQVTVLNGRGAYTTRLGVFALDASDPTQPSTGVQLTDSYGTRSIAAGPGGEVFVAGAVAADLQVFDASGSLVGTFEDEVTGVSLAVGDGRIAFGAGSDGVYLFRRSLFSTSADPAPPGGLAVTVAPSPTRSETRLSMDLGESRFVRAEVYDGIGRRVATLANGHHAAGPHEIHVSTQAWAPGLYIVRVQAGDAVLTHRLTVVR